MSDAMHAIDLETLLINEDQVKVNGTIGLDREMSLATTTTNLATLLDSVGTKEVW